MPRRRLKVYTEREMHAVIDEQKMERSFPEMGTKKLENYWKREVESGELSVRGVLECVGQEGEIDFYYDADVDFVIEEECEKHPGYWHRLVPLEKCLMCADERLRGAAGRAA